MITSLPIDRNVSPFLCIYDFVQFRKVSSTLYHDDEAWSIRAKKIVPNVTNPKRQLGLYYILSWASKLPSHEGTCEWYQQLVDWLQYKISINIIHDFILSKNLIFLSTMDMKNMSCSQRYHWRFLWHRYQRLYKPMHNIHNVRPVKRHKNGFSCRRIIQPCYG